VFTVPGRRGLEGLSPKHLALSGKARAGPREHGASGKRRHPGQALKEASVASQRSAHEIPVHTDGMRIGLLGGSFNPPHLAHRAISLFAIKRLKLDRIWWLVTPGNPLKDNGALHELEERAAAARQMAGDPRIDVTCLESVIGTRYTIDTITYLRRRASGLRFVWIMGADNLAQLHRWQHWRRITTQVPIAVIDRPPQSFRALRAPAAQALARYRLPENEASRLAGHRPPAWVFLTGLKLNLSSTGLRNPDGSWKIGK
jgi:nicotinate-nucleotide adenylyltransferase